MKRVRGKQQAKNKMAGWQQAEMAGPLVDSKLEEMCTSMASKLARSKATGLMNPVSLEFMPWCVFMHILILIRGYFAAFPAKLILSETARKL